LFTTENNFTCLSIFRDKDAISPSTISGKPAEPGKPDNGVGSVKADKHEKGSGKGKVNCK